MKIVVLTDLEHAQLLSMCTYAVDGVSPSALTAPPEQGGTALRPVWERVKEKVAEAK